MKCFKHVYFILIGVFLFAPIISAHAAGSAMFSVAASDLSPAVGEEVRIEVWVNPNGESIDTTRVNMTFDPAVMQAIRFDIGSAFPSLSPEYEIDNVSGTMTFGAYKFGTPVTSSSLLATVLFQTVAAGSTAISLDATSRLISEGEETLDAVLGMASGTVTLTVGGDAAVATDVMLEEQALVYFGAFAGRMPSSSVDWEALHCMAYGTCYPADIGERNLAHEQQSLVIFGAKYAHIPSTAADWRALHAIAYTDIFYDWASIDAGS